MTTRTKIRTPTQTDQCMKRFYQQYVSSLPFLISHTHNISQQDGQSYWHLLLQRLMVLYFLQTNGLLAHDRHYLHYQLHLWQSQQPQSFFRQFLLPLFHISLQKPNHQISLPCLQLPLFSRHKIEYDAPALHIDDEAFHYIFSILDQYQWQLYPATSTEPNTLSPLILSYCQEQQLNRRPIGAYYTQQSVAQYIANNTIIPFLLDSLQAEDSSSSPPSIPWQLIQQNPERYLSTTLTYLTPHTLETEREYHQRQQHIHSLTAQIKQGVVRQANDLVTYHLDLVRFTEDLLLTCQSPSTLSNFYQKLRNLTILDPTCGTGAFLLASTNLLAILYQLCFQRATELAAQRTTTHKYLDNILLHYEQYHSPLFAIHHDILACNLYGIELLPHIAEHCRLLLYLSLIAHLKEPHQVPAFPDVTSHIVTGNTLVGPLTPVENENNSSLINWTTYFYPIMKQGGFDIIIGNPPYVEHHRVRQEYTIHGYEEQSCGNLYAAVVERTLMLCKQHGRIGLIIPLSICSSERFSSLRTQLRQSLSSLWLTHFDIFPCRLFEHAFQRLTILLAHKCVQSIQTLYTTRIHRWYAAERSRLLDLITYTSVPCTLFHSVFPKCTNMMHVNIIQKLRNLPEKHSIEHVLSSKPTDHLIYYQEATNYWTKAVCYIPFYQRNGVVMTPPHGRILYFENRELAYLIMALMNSSLFYLWFATYSDGFHLSHALVKEFPLAATLVPTDAILQLAQQLEISIQSHQRRSTRNTRTSSSQGARNLSIELDEFHLAYSKPLMDSIDHYLATYYGLNDDEVQFIINYDEKYRMGK